MNTETFNRALERLAVWLEYRQAIQRANENMYGARQLISTGLDQIGGFLNSETLRTYDTNIRRANEQANASMRTHNTSVGRYNYGSELDGMRAAYAAAMGGPKVDDTALSKRKSVRLDAILQKYSSMKSPLAQQLVADVRAALEV